MKYMYTILAFLCFSLSGTVLPTEANLPTLTPEEIEQIQKKALELEAAYGDQVIQALEQNTKNAQPSELKEYAKIMLLAFSYVTLHNVAITQICGQISRDYAIYRPRSCYDDGEAWAILFEGSKNNKDNRRAVRRELTTVINNPESLSTPAAAFIGDLSWSASMSSIFALEMALAGRLGTAVPVLDWKDYQKPMLTWMVVLTLTSLASGALKCLGKNFDANSAWDLECVADRIDTVSTIGQILTALALPTWALYQRTKKLQKNTTALKNA